MVIALPCAFRRGGKAEQLFGVFGDDVAFEVDHIAADALGQRRLLVGVRDGRDGQARLGHARNGEADAVDGDRALLHDVAQDVGIRVDGVPDGGIVTLDARNRARRVDVPGDEVPAEAPVGRHRALQVDVASRRERAERGALERLVHDVCREGLGGDARGGQAHAVRGDAVADLHVVKDLWRLDLERGGPRAACDALDGADGLDDAGEHQRTTSLSTSRSSPRRSTLLMRSSRASAGDAKPCPPTGVFACAPPKNLGAR